MSDYIIKTYQPEFVEEQAKVGSEVTKNWKYLIQTPAEDLRKAYSQPDFDPETRLYCFKGDELVGFLTAKTMKSDDEEIGFLRFPFVLEEHAQVTDLLMERIFEVFKSKGISRVQGIAGELWGNSLEEGERWEFKKLGDRASAYLLDINSVEITETDPSVVQIDFDTDVNQIAEIYTREYGRDLEEIKQSLEKLKTNENLITFPVIKEGEEIVAFSTLYKDDTPAKCVQVHSYVKESKYYGLIQKSINTVCKEQEIELIQIFFREQQFQYTIEYEKIGFEYETKTVLLEKVI